MRELLPDNIALHERLEALPSRAHVLREPEVREVGTLTTWVSAFTTYIAIVAEVHPHRVKDTCAYMRLLIREALKYGGNGWITYDTVYRRNRTGPGARWDQLDPSLHIAYVIARADTPVTPCTLCNETDHTTEDCALASSQPPTRGTPRRSLPLSRPFSPRFTKRLAPYSPPTPRRVAICTSWNRGRCAFPGTCNFKHTCTICSDNHQARYCPRNPPDSGNQPAGPTHPRPTEPRH